jgi:hypothetical protein
VSAGARWRQLGEEPWASARMRCFMVGGRERAYAHAQAAVVGNVTVAALLRGLAGCCTGVAALAVVTSPSVVHSAMKAVMTAVHSFMTQILAMAPHFRVGRFAYFPHDVYGDREVVDLHSWRVDLLMNTTRMDPRSQKSEREQEK